MSEQRMIELAQETLEDNGIEDRIIAAGQFKPRGTSGASVAGAMLGGGVGDAVGGVAGGLGLGLGMVAGQQANAAASGLPPFLRVCVSESTVYGMRAHGRNHKPEGIVFAVPRKGLTAKVHQRVNVRVLELIQEDTGARIELEGSRLPITHSKDVLEILTQMPDSDQVDGDQV